MHVVLGLVGEVEVDHVLDVVHMDAASCNVGCHHDLDLAGAEVLEHREALVLAHVAREHLALHAAAAQRLEDVFGGGLAVAEHDGSGFRMKGDVVEEHLELVFGADHVHDLADGVGGVVVAFDLGLDGGVHPARCEAHHVVGERGGVEHRGAFVARGQMAHDAAHVGDEAHVEHAVGLVDDERIDFAEIEHAALAEVEQAAGCGHEQIDRRVEDLLLLAVEVHPAVDGERAEAAVLADRVGVLADLYHELARWRDNKRARAATLLGAALWRAQIAR